jgi:putative aldouronate transport system permease protein
VKKSKFTIFTLLKGMFLLFIIGVTLYPFINMIAVSLSDNIYLMRNEVTFYPKGFTMKAYRSVFQDKRIFNGFFNTVMYTTLGTVISLIGTACGAYSLSKPDMLFHKFFTMMTVFTMFFSGGMIPIYLVIKGAHLINTMWAVILPGAISAWNVIILRSFFYGIPKELEESCKIDGLNDIQIFWHIILPLSKPALASVGLFVAVGLWNSFFGPFLYLTDEKKYPLQVILRDIVVAGDMKSAEGAGGGVGDTAVIPEAIRFATILVSTLPIIMVYPFIQKYFVTGMMIGAVKG